MLSKNGERWGGNVRLIGLSIDNECEKVKSHVETKGWTAVEHYHVRNGKCTGDKEWGVQGVPHVAIVDTKGKVVFMGHPANRPDLVKDFDDLLAGKEMTGKGCSAAGGDEDEDEEGGFKSNCDAADVDAAVKLFNELSTEHLQTDAVKEACEGMPRAFCVLVVANQFDVKQKKLEASLTNYHVLVGPQDKVDKGKELLKPFADQKWTVSEQIRAM